MIKKKTTKDCNNILESNLSIEVILYRLKKIINKYNKKRNFNNKFLRFIINYIHKICWLWAKKKHKKVGKIKYMIYVLKKV